MLFNNGYIVKDCKDNEELLINDNVYRGIQSYHNWPLERENDSVSRQLTKEVNQYFDEHDYIEILRDATLLKKYVAHCKKRKIDVIVMKIMSKDNSFIADKDFGETEVLGYDCMAGDSVSYLTEVFTEDSVLEGYKRFREKLNVNGLLSTYEEVEDFIKERNKLLEQGIHLEDYWEPVPVKLSLVAIE